MTALNATQLITNRAGKHTLSGRLASRSFPFANQCFLQAGLSSGDHHPSYHEGTSVQEV
jgi:hypothetical protein